MLHFFCIFPFCLLSKRGDRKMNEWKYTKHENTETDKKRQHFKQISVNNTSYSSLSLVANRSDTIYHWSLLPLTWQLTTHRLEQSNIPQIKQCIGWLFILYMQVSRWISSIIIYKRISHIFLPMVIKDVSTHANTQCWLGVLKPLNTYTISIHPP